MCLSQHTGYDAIVRQLIRSALQLVEKEQWVPRIAGGFGGVSKGGDQHAVGHIALLGGTRDGELLGAESLTWLMATAPDARTAWF